MKTIGHLQTLKLRLLFLNKSKKMKTLSENRIPGNSKMNSFIQLFNVLLIVFLLVFVAGCGSAVKKQPAEVAEEKNEIPEEKIPSGFVDLVPSVFKIDTYENSRILESGMGFFVSEDLAVTRFSFFESANRAVIQPFDETKSYEITGFVAIDRINDLILLKVEGLKKKPVVLSETINDNDEKTTFFDKPQGNTIPLHEGKILSYSSALGVKLYRVSNQLRSKSAGTPIFNSARQCIGLTFT